MGHQRLKNLPRSQRWDQVVELLDDAGSVSEIAGASARAIDRALAVAANDPALTETILLLARLPGAARQTDFRSALTGLGISAGEVSLIELIGGIERAVDRESRMRGRRTDLGEIAQHAAATSLTKALVPDLPMLFGTTPDDLKVALAKLDTPDRFGRVSRTFFADLVRRSLEYYLSRTYSLHIGPSESFRSIGEQETFQEALASHCFEAALIVEKYSSDWFSKAKFNGGITRQKASILARTSLKKLRLELSARSRSDV